MKILHLHLRDSFGNAKTLVCSNEDGIIRYRAWSGHGSSGTRLRPDDLYPGRGYFPVDNPNGLSLGEFKDSITSLWSPWVGKDYGPKIESVVQNKVEFK